MENLVSTQEGYRAGTQSDHRRLCCYAPRVSSGSSLLLTHSFALSALGIASGPPKPLATGKGSRPRVLGFPRSSAEDPACCRHAVQWDFLGSLPRTGAGQVAILLRHRSAFRPFRGLPGTSGRGKELAHLNPRIVSRWGRPSPIPSRPGTHPVFFGGPASALSRLIHRTGEAGSGGQERYKTPLMAVVSLVGVSGVRPLPAMHTLAVARG
jgi:hypothetical protein